jgi:hydrogenase/urease accessory protein HupE
MPLAILLLCAALSPNPAHPTSVSSTRVEVRGAEVAVRIRCEDQTLRECLSLDSNGDEHIDAVELASGRDEIARYVLAGWRLADLAGEAVRGELVELALVPDSSPAKIDIALHFAATHELEGVTIDFALFRESDPFHRDTCEVTWNRAEPAGRLLWVEDPTWHFDPEVAESSFDVFGAFVRHGVEHILLGFDHIAFVLALVLGARSRRAVLAVVTAFTVAHSVTLALAAFGVVTLPASLVEPAIALSIAWVAARNLWQRDGRAPWIEAFLFGLVHGLGFAGAIGATLASEPRKLSALVGFNLGVEAGQLAVVAAVLSLYSLARVLARGPQRAAPPDPARTGKRAEQPAVQHAEQRARPRAETIAPRWLASAASIAVAVLGVYWFVERVVA